MGSHIWGPHIRYKSGPGQLYGGNMYTLIVAQRTGDLGIFWIQPVGNTGGFGEETHVDCETTNRYRIKNISGKLRIRKQEQNVQKIIQNMKEKKEDTES